MIETKKVTQINSDGATFNAEFINLGKDEIVEYGFFFGGKQIPIIIFDSTLLHDKANKGVFSKTMDARLAGNTIYHVKGYAKTNNNIVYGNEIEFESQGSKYSPWDLFHNTDFRFGRRVYFTNDNEKGFIITTESGAFRSYDPISNTFKTLKKVPIDGHSGTRCATFALGGFVYFISNDLQNVLRYDMANDIWEAHSSRPLVPDDQTHGLVANGTGYFLSTSGMYYYDSNSQIWVKKTDSPSSTIHSAQVIGNKVYVMAGPTRTIFMYDLESNVWVTKTQYPGQWKAEIIAFTLNNKIYWGLSYSTGVNAMAVNDMWEYNTTLNSWKEVESLPLTHSGSELIAFSINSVGYFGYGYNDPSRTTDLFEIIVYRFDPQKIK